MYKPITGWSIEHLFKFCGKIQKTDFHWLWTGTICKRDGYGIFTIRNNNYYAHRISWFVHHQEDPGVNFVLHKVDCHLRLCINPNHLYLGSKSDNNFDRTLNGTNIQQGSFNGNTKFSDENILDIRHRYQAGETQKSLAKFYAVHKCTIYRIVNNIRFATVGDKTKCLTN
jgi:hypothetical protein